MKQVFKTEDGTTFDTRAECKAYEEQESLGIALSDLSPIHIKDAFDRKNITLADTIERAGAIIAAKRRESGDLKRAKKSAAKNDAAAQMAAIKENMKAIS